MAVVLILKEKKLKMKVPIPRFLNSVKFTLSIVNGVFLLTGLLLLLVGVTVLAIFSEYDGLITNKFITMPSFVIATGTIILLVSVLGFYGAYSEQFYFIAGYVIMLIVVLVFEVSTVIVMYRLNNDAASDIRSTMVASLNQYHSRREIAQQWDDLQMKFQCCGAVNRFDWISYEIPISCCYIDYGQVSPFVCDSLNAYPLGCVEALGEWLSYNALVVAVAALVTTCFQVPITLAAGWLAWRAKFEEIELES